MFDLEKYNLQNGIVERGHYDRMFAIMCRSTKYLNESYHVNNYAQNVASFITTKFFGYVQDYYYTQDNKDCKKQFYTSYNFYTLEEFINEKKEDFFMREDDESKGHPIYIEFFEDNSNKEGNIIKRSDKIRIIDNAKQQNKNNGYDVELVISKNLNPNFICIRMNIVFFARLIKENDIISARNHFESSIAHELVHSFDDFLLNKSIMDKPQNTLMVDFKNDDFGLQTKYGKLFGFIFQLLYVIDPAEQRANFTQWDTYLKDLNPNIKKKIQNVLVQKVTMNDSNFLNDMTGVNLNDYLLSIIMTPTKEINICYINNTVQYHNLYETLFEYRKDFNTRLVIIVAGYYLYKHRLLKFKGKYKDLVDGVRGFQNNNMKLKDEFFIESNIMKFLKEGRFSEHFNNIFVNDVINGILFFISENYRTYYKKIAKITEHHIEDIYNSDTIHLKYNAEEPYKTELNISNDRLNEEWEKLKQLNMV